MRHLLLAAIFLAFLTVDATAGAALSPDDFTWGIEPTAATLGNEDNDIGKPVGGKVIDYPLVVANHFAELTGGTVKALFSVDSIWEDVKSLSVDSPWGLYQAALGVLSRQGWNMEHGAIAVRTPGGRVWKFHNDHGLLEATSPDFRLSEDVEIEQVFQAFEMAGLVPQVGASGMGGGGGHIHFGKQIFEKDPLLLRNWIFDMNNRPYIQALFEEMGDSNSYSIRELEKISELKKNFVGIDAKLARGESVDLKTMSRAYMESISTAAEIDEILELPSKEVQELTAREHLKARISDLNFANILFDKIPTVEYRVPRAPTSARMQRLRLQFMQKYLMWLSRERSLVQLREYTPQQMAEMTSPTGVWKHFAALAAKIGMNPADFHDEWRERFPLLAVDGVKTERGFELEIRPGRAPEEDLELEILIRAPKIDAVKFFVGDKEAKKTLFHEADPGVWVAVVRVKGDIDERGLTYIPSLRAEIIADGKKLAGFSRTYKLDWSYRANHIPPKAQRELKRSSKGRMCRKIFVS